MSIFMGMPENSSNFLMELGCVNAENQYPSSNDNVGQTPILIEFTFTLFLYERNSFLDDAAKAIKHFFPLNSLLSFFQSTSLGNSHQNKIS